MGISGGCVDLQEIPIYIRVIAYSFLPIYPGKRLQSPKFNEFATQGVTDTAQTWNQAITEKKHAGEQITRLNIVFVKADEVLQSPLHPLFVFTL